MRRKVLRVVVAVVVLPPLALVGAFFVFARHVAWKPAAEDRIPPALAAPSGGLSIRFLGVSGYEISDGSTVVLLDPTPTRPPPSALLTGPLVPDEVYGKELCPRADFILVNHAHFDHALDVPAIALRTGAKVLGSQSTVNLARSRGVPEAKTQVVKSGDHLTLGSFTLDVRSSRHTAIGPFEKPMAGTIAANAGPLWFWQYTIDDTLFYRLESSHSSVWFHPTSTFARQELEGPPAQLLIVGVTGEKATVEKARAITEEAAPRIILPTHYDNFFQPMQKGLALMPGLDLNAARAIYRTAAPTSSWVVLDYGETLYLPPDPK